MKIRQWEPSCSSRTDGLTDRYHEANNLFTQFYKSASKYKRAVQLQHGNFSIKYQF